MSSEIVQLTAVLSVLTLLGGIAFFYFARKSRLFSSMSVSFLLFLMFAAAFHSSKALGLPQLTASVFEAFMVLALLMFAWAHYSLAMRTQTWF